MGEPSRGLTCATCGDRLRVIDSRVTEEGHIRRRRECVRGHRVTSYEIIPRDDEAIVVRHRRDGVGSRLEVYRFWAGGEGELGFIRPLKPIAVACSDGERGPRAVTVERSGPVAEVKMSG